MATQKSKKIRESLLNQLHERGADIDHFTALVDDYVNYFEIVEKMKRSVLQRGITYMAMSAAGKEYEKDNPCVKQLPQYTRAMLTILKDLGLTTDNVAGDDEEL